MINADTKRRWRRVIRAGRHARGTQGTLPGSADYLPSLKLLTRSPNIRQIASFLPHGLEPNILPFLKTWDRVLLPHLFDQEGAPLPAGQWSWWHPGDRLNTPKPWAPAQPERDVPGALREVDLILIPALAVDLSGTRLGQGGGWYDRALLSLPQEIPRVAVVYPFEVLPEQTLPREEHDIVMDSAITSQGHWRIFAHS